MRGGEAFDLLAGAQHRPLRHAFARFTPTPPRRRSRASRPASSCPESNCPTGRSAATSREALNLLVHIERRQGRRFVTQVYRRRGYDRGAGSLSTWSGSMNGSERHRPTTIAADYLRDNFEPTDRLAVVLLNKRTGAVIQRLAAAEKIAAPDFQAWLRHKNAQALRSLYLHERPARRRPRPHQSGCGRRSGMSIWTSMRTARRRSKRCSSARICRSRTTCINSSPDKWQVVWKVEGFGKSASRRIAKGPGARNAAPIRRPPIARASCVFQDFTTTSTPSRISSGRNRLRKNLRARAVSGVSIRRRGTEISAVGSRLARGRGQGRVSQSERDWAYAKRALSRGEPPETVIAAIAN